MSDKNMINNEGCVVKVAQTVLETEYGDFDFMVFLEPSTGKEHIVLRTPSVLSERSDISPLKGGESTPLVRIHSECATGDIFASEHCDCGSQLHEAQKLVQEQGGAIIYLKQEGRGIGLTEKIKAYELQRQGKDTVEANLELGRGADERAYELAVDILRSLKIKKLKLLTNNPDKVAALQDYGFEVEQIQHQVEVKSDRAKKYLETKKEKMGHQID